MAHEPKKIFVNDITIVSADLLNTIFGGNISASQDDPAFGGHLHDGRQDEWGHAPKINLTNHVTGSLTLPQPELKSIKLSATQAVPLTSSLYWTVPVPPDAYTATAKPMFLNIYWSANDADAPGSTAFRVDWTYIQAGNNVMPPSVISRDEDDWPANTLAANNPETSTMRFKVSDTAASRLYINDTLTGGNLIQLSLPSSLPNSTLGQFKMLGLEITTAPTVTLTNPMDQVNLFAIEVLYYSQTLGYNNSNPTLLLNDSGLFDYE